MRDVAEVAEREQREVTLELAPGGANGFEVLAPIGRRRRERIRSAGVVPVAVRPERRIDARVGHADSLPRDRERLDDVARGELRVREHHVAVSRLLRIGGVHPHGARVQLLRVFQRPEVVDHRRADAGTLRRIHPVREMEDVEAADEPFGGRPPEPAPRPPGRVRERHGHEAPVGRDAVQRLLEQRPPADADRSERDELVRAGRRVRHSAQGAEHVVADARPRVREGRDVVGDPHGAV